jgi:uncharacterized membrane protein
MIGDVLITIGILMIIYGAYRGLKANNIFMKNPSKRPEDRFNNGRNY